MTCDASLNSDAIYCYDLIVICCCLLVHCSIFVKNALGLVMCQQHVVLVGLDHGVITSRVQAYKVDNCSLHYIDNARTG